MSGYGLIAALTVSIAACSSPQTSTPTLSQLSHASGYLEQLYNPSIGLCPETSISESTPKTITDSEGKSYTGNTDNIYWIASDNYFDFLALKPHDATRSELIKKKCDSYLQNSPLQGSNLQGLPYSPYQIMAGNPIPLTQHDINTYVLEQTSDNNIIALNVSNGEINGSNYSDYPSEGDILVYEAINYYIQGYPIDWSQKTIQTAYNMFDEKGDEKGVADAAYSSTSEYDNYKLALLIFGAKVLDLNVNLTQIESQLWSAQKPSGGITACMDSNGKPTGTANNETTALTLLAYDKDLIGQIQSERACSPSQKSLNVTFPTATFNQNTDISSLSRVNDLTSIPLFYNWQVPSPTPLSGHRPQISRVWHWVSSQKSSSPRRPLNQGYRV